MKQIVWRAILKTLRTLRALLRVVMRWERQVEISESWLMILHQVLISSWSLIQNIYHQSIKYLKNIIINKIFIHKYFSFILFIGLILIRFSFFPWAIAKDWPVITIGKGTFLQSQTPQPVTYVLWYSRGTLFPSRIENKHDCTFVCTIFLIAVREFGLPN